MSSGSSHERVTLPAAGYQLADPTVRDAAIVHAEMTGIELLGPTGLGVDSSEVESSGFALVAVTIARPERYQQGLSPEVAAAVPAPLNACSPS